MENNRLVQHPSYETLLVTAFRIVSKCIQILSAIFEACARRKKLTKRFRRVRESLPVINSSYARRSLSPQNEKRSVHLDVYSRARFLGKKGAFKVNFSNEKQRNEFVRADVLA